MYAYGPQASRLMHLVQQDDAALALVLDHMSLREWAAFARVAAPLLAAAIAYLRELLQRLGLRGMPHLTLCLSPLATHRLHTALTNGTGTGTCRLSGRGTWNLEPHRELTD